MQKIKTEQFALLFSLPLVILIIITSSFGLFSDSLYSAETRNWKVQAIGQDIIDLFLVVPALLISTVFIWKGNRKAFGIWGGLLLYLIYSFTIYAFAVHFNFLFIIYCIILGISFYGFVYLLLHHYDQNVIDTTFSAPLKMTANFFIVIALAFYMLWLLQIIPPTVQNKIPDEISSSGLLTNPVHALDLSICLPGIFMTGILLLRRKPLGFFLAPMVLVFMLAMNITIGILTVLMKQKGITNDPTMAFIMFLLGALTLFLLIRIMRTRVT